MIATALCYQSCHRLRLVFVTLLAVGLLSANSPKNDLQLERHKQGFLFVETGQPVLFYQLAPKSLNGQSRRANYIHPLYGLDGEILTEDFPADHIHHRGVFWAWHQILIRNQKISNSWLASNFLTRVIEAKSIPTDDGSVTAQVRSEWVSPKLPNAMGKSQAFLEEVTFVRVHPSEENLRKIDFVIHLNPLVDDLFIGGSENDKGYGGFSVRTRLPEDIRFLSSRGPLTPRRTAFQAGPWIDLTASFSTDGTQLAGVSILCHPSLPGFPQPWILRSSGSMQNPVWPGTHPVHLPRGKPLVLRYRLIVHRGDLDRDTLEHLHRSYGNE